MFKHLIPLLNVYLKVKDQLSPWLRVIFRPKILVLGWLFWIVIDTWHHYPRWQSACVDHVLDGDTLKYHLLGNSNSEVGRLWHIDAFEKKQQPWGNKGYVKLKSFLGFQSESESACVLIYIKAFEKDIYRRNLVLVKKNKADFQTINEKMLAVGLALIYPGTNWPSHDQGKWKRIQEVAKITKTGVWKYSKRFWDEPWDYRRKIKLSKMNTF